MPTVTNHDILGHLSWGESARQASLVSKNGDHGYGVNALLFGGGQCQDSNPNLIAAEHDYAAPQRFVSSNSYYGYHPVVTAEAAVDCSMDTSENNLPLGVHPNTCGVEFAGADVPNAVQGAWCANVSRKRFFESEPDVSEHACKRIRQDSIQDTTPTGAPNQRFGLQSSMQAQTFDLPNHQLPGSTSHMVDSLVPRPRCLMDNTGAVLKTENVSGENLLLRIAEESETATLENLLKQTHGCDFYNYESCDF